MHILLSWVLAAMPTMADMGEIDLMVKDSIEQHFGDYSLQVDTDRLNYYGQLQIQDDVITIESSVWGQQRLSGKLDWGWHDCTTKLKQVRRGVYSNLGSDCHFVFD